MKDGNAYIGAIPANMFPSNFDFVGQGHIKKRLQFYTDAYADTGIFPNLMLKASKGMGKTMIARIIAAQLSRACESRFNDLKYIMEINCASMKSADDWIPKFLSALNQNKHVTYFFDEFHALPSAVSDWLLTALDPDKAVKEVHYGHLKATLDFRKATFIAATTEPQKVFTALANRFQSLELVEYSEDSLSFVIRANANKGISPETWESFDYLAKYTRGNARSAADIGREIARYVEVKKVERFGKTEAEDLINILGIFPMGLSRTEFDMLKIIHSRPSVSLTALCAMTGLTRPAQQESEQFLMKRGLIDIDGKSKLTLTPQGLDYLAHCEAGFSRR